MKKTLQGKVVSTKTPKTVVVEVVSKVAHKMYKKLLKRDKRYKVDVSEIVVSIGDKVEIEETRPLSRDKHFKIKKIIQKSEGGV